MNKYYRRRTTSQDTFLSDTYHKDLSVLPQSCTPHLQRPIQKNKVRMIPSRLALTNITSVGRSRRLP